MKYAIVLVLIACCPLAASAADERPNLIVLLADDQRADDLGCYANPVIHTPHLDALAARGVRFSRFYVTSAICMASRASFFTGRVTANIDIAPSLLELAGVSAQDGIQGRSLLGLLRGDSPLPWRESLLCENLAKERRPMCDALGTRDWKYIAYFEMQPLQEELYHLAEDPHEQHNLANDPLHQAIKHKLAQELQAMRVELSGTPSGFPQWIQSQKENTSNWQGYRDAYLRLSRP